MPKNNILLSLEERLKEQQMLQYIPFARLFFFVVHVLGENPWRILIPIACIVTFLLHALFGNIYDNHILGLFGDI